MAVILFRPLEFDLSELSVVWVANMCSRCSMWFYVSWSEMYFYLVDTGDGQFSKSC